MALIVYSVALDMIREIKPVIDDVRRHDRELANQMKDAAQSAVLNIAEGDRSHGRNQLVRYSTAAGSSKETRAAVSIALAWGYTSEHRASAADQRLDRMLGLLWGLCHPRR